MPSDRKAKYDPEEKISEKLDMECGTIRSRNMGNKGSRYEEVRKL